ncbi:spermidine/spermine N(1)-acetyltransferase-like protein 1 [Nannospalax galili]|uniref:spermidine/spermine N(1)-acetyltransferase-like protein 1 n=1 Tax=Nannospalax galili TaxID=1026970 RepID=UPI0004ED2005|nr:spermidine/spermine N(1)-acetyltransferase-like protein 1 [Nannospalax galili]
MSHLDTKQPGTTQSGKSQSDTSQPSATQSSTTSPLVTSQSGSTQSSTNKLDTSKSGATQSGTSQQGMIRSDTVESGTGQLEVRDTSSETNQTDSSQPGISQLVLSNLERSKSSMSDPARSHLEIIQAFMRKTSTAPFHIRSAEPEDCPDILHLIKELAACEGLVDEVTLTEMDLFRDGFGSNPLFHCLIAEAPNQQIESGTLTIGFAMYYFTYDTRIGKVLHLEDFYITEAYQGQGIGTEMLKKLSQVALSTQCNAMQFLVVIWNQESVEYYTRLGALDLSCEGGWHLFRFKVEDLLEIAEE